MVKKKGGVGRNTGTFTVIFQNQETLTFAWWRAWQRFPDLHLKVKKGVCPTVWVRGYPGDERMLSYFHLAVPCSRWGDSSSPWRSGNVGYGFFGSFTKVVKLESKRRVCMFFLCFGLGGLCYHLWGRRSFVQRHQQPCGGGFGSWGVPFCVN